MHEGESVKLLETVSRTFIGFLQPILAFDEKRKDEMKAWHGTKADVDAVQMELGVQEDQEILEWESTEEYSVLAYKGVGNKEAFEP